MKVRVGREFDDLEKNPRHPGVIKLTGSDGLYRVRAGDYRVIFEIHDSRLLVLVLRIRHRSDAY